MLALCIWMANPLPVLRRHGGRTAGRKHTATSRQTARASRSLLLVAAVDYVNRLKWASTCVLAHFSGVA